MAKIKQTDNTKWWEEHLQDKWNSHVFAAANKNMVQPPGKWLIASYTDHHTLAILYGKNSTPRHSPNENLNIRLPKNLSMNIYRGLIHNSLKL